MLLSMLGLALGSSSKHLCMPLKRSTAWISLALLAAAAGASGLLSLQTAPNVSMKVMSAQDRLLYSLS
jgi:hypothetical protein